VKALVARCLVRDPDVGPVRDSKHGVVADPDLRDTENVPLSDRVDEYLAREVLPHVDDAWVEDEDGKIGYEIPFTRLFYKYRPPRPSEEIKAELRMREERIRQLLEEALI
jgi:type I restriction enzyme M protein